MVELKKVNLGDIITFKNGKKKPAEEGTIPIYGGNGILGYTDRSNYKNCIAVGRVGAYCGSVYYEPGECWISDNAIAATPKADVDIYFAFYLLKSLNLNQRHIGTSQPLLTQEILNKIECQIPDLDIQKKISNILRTVDGKVECNTAINRNLSEQAFAIFEEEYQSFSTAKIGELPIVVKDYVANGSFKSLKDNVTILEEKEYAYFIRNVDLKAKTFPRFVNQHSYEFLRKSRLEGGEVIISNVGDVGSVFLCPVLDGPMTLGNNMIMLNTEKHNSYLYLYFKSHIGQGMIAGITGGSAQPKFNKTDFKSLEIKYPNDDQVEAFNRKVKNLLDMIEKNDQENKKLEELRDRLLPKLMSGELDVSELEI